MDFLGLNNKQRLVVPLIAIIYFIINYYIALTLYLNGVFFQNDLIFDTDAFTNLMSLSHGIQEGRFAFSHAFLEILSIPIYGVQYFITKIYPHANERYIREILAISYSPLFGALNLIVFSKIAREFNINKLKLLLFILIYGVSFSTFAFSSIPETFIISGFLINLSLYFLLCSREGDNNYIAWLVLGILLAGVTITNICIFFMIYFFSRIKNELSFLKSFLDSVSMSFLVSFIVLLYYKLVMLICVPETQLAHEGKLEWISRFLVTSFSHALSNISNMISAVFNSFFNLYLNIDVTNYCVNKHCTTFSFIRNSDDILILAVSLFFVLYLLLFSYKYFVKNDRLMIYFLLIFILGFNFALHTVFGNEMFLYSQHWFAVTVLLFLLPISNIIILIFLLITQLYLAGYYVFKMNEFFYLTWPLLN